MKRKGRVLIVDDNVDLLAGMKLFLGPHVESVTTLKNPNLIPETLRREVFDVILLDMNFTGGINSGNEGLYWMKRIMDMQPLASVLLITAFGDVELAVKAMKEGATDFIQKSWDEEKILSTIISAIALGQSKKEIQDLRQKQKHLNEGASRQFIFCEPVSESMKSVTRVVQKVAPTDANILILGENGTGKEVVARELHRLSSRNDEIFVSVNITAIPETLFESELFGHVKGAFTDAKEAKAGRFEIANHGTLFLDEIGNLPLSMQTKLLSVLQEKMITRLGSANSIPIDFRLICATNMPLEKMVEDGTFRRDLLFRINTIVIEVPPLRERPEDIPSLVDFYSKLFAEKYRKKIVAVDEKSMQQLLRFSWPGNVRELQHAVEKAVILCDEDILTFDEIRTPKTVMSEGFNLDDHEMDLIRRAMKKNRGNISATAAALGINRSTLYEKLRKYNIR
ncbi:MAG TPA: sigma-54 dependent transcriptional regulator [Bacteroidales bacterium]|jgi:DNA-binding NtrC family response regulator|nr:sigma-54 dependent transcriptional regulator [Bacteroidales bacterium]